MNYKHCSVIDKNGYYKTFVLVHLEEDGTTTKCIDSYNLKDGESLIDALVPENMAKPKWDGEAWKETFPPPPCDPDTQIATFDGETWIIEDKPIVPATPELATKDEVLEAYMALALLYEENLILQEQNLAVMEAVTELYEMII